MSHLRIILLAAAVFFVAACNQGTSSAAPSSSDDEYTVHASIQMMRPFDPSSLNDSFQSGTITAQDDQTVSFDVDLYPYRSRPDVVPNPDWKEDDASMQEYLQPYPATNWDESLQAQLLSDLQAAGITPSALDDLTLVTKVSQWALHRMHGDSQSVTDFLVQFQGGVPAILPALEPFFEQHKGDPSWTDEEQFEHELLGKQMYLNQSFGACTSYAIYQATVLRALGIPTRVVQFIPVVDASDPAQLGMVSSGIGDSKVSQAILGYLQPVAGDFVAHTYNEVYVGHQWVRLNYDAVSQPILDAHYLGLMVHVNTYDDLSEIDFAPTWGARYALEQRIAPFLHSNPYRTTALRDH